MNNLENNPVVWNPGSFADLQAVNDENKTVIWNTTENRIVEVIDNRFKWVRDIIAYFKKGPDMVSGSMARFKIAEAEKRIMHDKYMSGIDKAYDKALHVSSYDDIEKNINSLRQEMTSVLEAKVTERFIDVHFIGQVYSPDSDVKEKIRETHDLMNKLAEMHEFFDPNRLLPISGLNIFSFFEKIKNTGELGKLYDHLAAQAIEDLLVRNGEINENQWIELT